MANGNGNISWQHLLAKHGPWALGCAVLGFVVYSFVLTPSANEREAFIKTSIENAESMHVVAGSTKDIKGSVERQEITMNSMQEQLEKQSELRAAAMDTMTAFAEEMRKINPDNSKKLDVLMQKIMNEDNWAIKLDQLLDKLDKIMAEVMGALNKAHPEINGDQ